MRALRLLTVAVGLAALAASAGSGRAERQAVPPSAEAVVAGASDTCVLTRAGGVECWGYNGQGELGDGKTADSFTPRAVSGLTSGVTAIAEGFRNACALTRGGGVKCWGAAYFGALGDGTTTQHSDPVDVVGLTSGARAISAGSDAACAVTGSGGAKCWGENFQGQLGDGTAENRTTPVDVSGLPSGVTAVASELDLQTCAIAGGHVACWGRGHLTPAGVTGLGDDVKATTGACALTAAGAVECWGYDLAAADVPGLSGGVVSIASSGDHDCALLSGGGVKCWGNNSRGQLGDGTTNASATPVDVAGLPGPAVAIATGAFHTCAVLRSGGVDCWGANSAGQLGDGTTVDRMRPVAVEGLGAATTTATVAIVSRSIHVTRRRVAAVRLRCVSTPGCHGSLALVAASGRLGGRPFSIDAGSRAVAVTLTKRGFARLVHARRLTARVTVSGAVTGASQTITLVSP